MEAELRGGGATWRDCKSVTPIREWRTKMKGREWKKYMHMIECLVSDKNPQGAISLKTEPAGRETELSSNLKILWSNFIMHGHFIIKIRFLKGIICYSSLFAVI